MKRFPTHSCETKLSTSINTYGYVALCLLALFFACNKPVKPLLPASAYDKVLDSTANLYNSNRRGEALHYLDSATSKYKNLSLLQKFEYYYHHLNFYHHVKGDNTTAMLYADSVLALFDAPEVRSAYMQYYARAIFFKGDILFDEKAYDEAYQYYYNGKMIASSTLDSCNLSDYSYRMGMITYNQGYFRKAAAYFKASSTETMSCHLDLLAFYRRQELLSNTGLCYSKINEADSAMFFFKKCLVYIDSAGALYYKGHKEMLDAAKGVVYGNEADEYIKLKRFNQAKILLEKSFGINLRKGNDNHDAELSELKLAHIYEQEGQPDSMIAVLNNVKAQLDSVKNDDAEADLSLMMANYLDKRNEPAAAYAYLRRYDSLKDSLTNTREELKQTDIGEQMERQKKNYEFEKLKKNNHIQHLYLKIAIVFGAMLLLIIFLIWFTWQRSRKNMKTLGRLNDQINDQNHNLESALTELSESSLEKDRILRTVAHDLRNPLGGVASLTGLMVEESDYTDEQKELIKLIKDTSNNSLELINEILEATDDVSAKISREKAPVEINSLLSNSIELMRFKASEKHQQIILNLLDTPVDVIISREQIWRVIGNMVSNAIKFSPDGSVICVSLTNEPDQVMITVADNGIGIPDKLKHVIFNMFTDAKRPGTAGEKSFGLGLSICKQIIENHKGKIWFESEAGKGTSFFITLNKAAM